MTTTLAVTKRLAKGGARALRKAGSLPGVVYGAHQEATAIAIDAKAFGKALASAGESTIVSLEGLGATLPTLIHEIDLDPVTHEPRHVDFYAVTKGQKVEVAVPLSFVGESPALKTGASLVKVLYEIQIEADPINLPHEIEVDTESLELGGQIHAGALKLPAGVTLITDPEEVVVLIQEVSEEPVEEAPADISSIEVEGKGKEEGAEGEEAGAAEEA